MGRTIEKSSGGRGPRRWWQTDYYLRDSVGEEDWKAAVVKVLTSAYSSYSTCDVAPRHDYC
jgi:hypothetical protein